jgi:SAM-dependent methyltransferase
LTSRSEDIYDALAPHYREYSEKKSLYLKAVDKYIVDRVSSGKRSLLDVGAGDGIRGMDIARQCGIGYTVLCEPSAEMVKKCEQLKPSQIWQTTAENLPDSDKKFDVALCLWNVLGHLPNRSARVQALARIRELLTEDGMLFFDVNNRHNASSYGMLEVLKRTAIDFVSFDEKRGDASFDWKIGDKVFPAMGHLFTPKEIEDIIKESGLKIKDRVSVNYASGAVSKQPWRGQLLYRIEK